jgi:hypothetical protein
MGSYLASRPANVNFENPAKVRQLDDVQPGFGPLDLADLGPGAPQQSPEFGLVRTALQACVFQVIDQTSVLVVVYCMINGVLRFS